MSALLKESKPADRLRSPDEEILLSRHNRATLQLIKKLFPNKKGDAVYYGERRTGGRT